MVHGAGDDTRVGSDAEVAAGEPASEPPAHRSLSEPPAHRSLSEPPAHRSLTEPMVAAGAAAASVVLVGAVYPRYPELFPSCPSRTLFGVWCPLCGGTSSASALATGRVSDAFRFNAFVPVLV
ncbi:MAG: DUF2752 domain-containing protein, partial [Nitriliruptoraceae bacterium]